MNTNTKKIIKHKTNKKIYKIKNNTKIKNERDVRKGISENGWKTEKK